MVPRAVSCHFSFRASWWQGSWEGWKQCCYWLVTRCWHYTTVIVNTTAWIIVTSFVTSDLVPKNLEIWTEQRFVSWEAWRWGWICSGWGCCLTLTLSFGVTAICWISLPPRYLDNCLQMLLWLECHSLCWICHDDVKVVYTHCSYDVSRPIRRSS